MTNRRMHRRSFLGCAATDAAGLTILRNSASVWGAPADTKLNIAMIGVGGRGRELLGGFVQSGNVATQFEGVLEYDPLAGRILNNPEADKALGSEYRQGWTL